MARMTTNKVSSLVDQLEIKVDVKASAEEFYHMFARRPDLISDASPGIQSCDLLDGEWGTTGSIIFWNYLFDGKVMVAKDMIEEVDPEKNLIKLRVLEGDLVEQFKNFAFTLQVTPKRNEPGSIASWHLEYEKFSEDVAHRETLMQLGVAISKQIDRQLFSQP